MDPAPERRRKGPERGKYPILRFYTKVISLSSFVVLGVGVLFGILVILYAEQPFRTRLWNGFAAIGVSLIYFVLARATAEVLYLLLDVARTTRATHDLLEQQSSERNLDPQPPIS